MGKVNQNTQIILDALRRFPSMPNLTLAKYILYTAGDFFDNDLEKIRTKIRVYVGKHGNKNRDDMKTVVIRTDTPKMPQTWRKIRIPYHLSPGLWLVINDLHIPFHEPKPIEVALSYAKSKKVTGLLFNGDMQDYEAISYWPSARKRDFDREVELFIDFLDLISYEFPTQTKVYKPGNHEYRLPRKYQVKAPELMGMPHLAMEMVLDFEGRNIEFLDYYQMVMAGELPIIHGHEIRNVAQAVTPARGLFLQAKTWAIMGHCHQTSQDTKKNLTGITIPTWSIGCLCDLSPDYNPFGNNWCWGFAIIHVDKSGHFEVENRRILDNGKVV